MLLRLGEAVRQTCLLRSALRSYSPCFTTAAREAVPSATLENPLGKSRGGSCLWPIQQQQQNQEEETLKSKFLHREGNRRRSFSSQGAIAKDRFNWKLAQGFLFDIDGTLTDTDPLHHAAFKHCLSGTGSKLVLDDDYFRDHCAGRSNGAIAQHLLPHASEREREHFILDKEAYFFELVKAEIKPIVSEAWTLFSEARPFGLSGLTPIFLPSFFVIFYYFGFLLLLQDGLLELMDWIKQSGAKCAAVTNNTKPSATMVLETLQLKDTFDLLVFAEECTRSKPHPDPYLAAMQMLELDQPERCVAFEDSVVGATAAVAANLHTVGILTNQKAHILKQAGVKQTISTYHELLEEILTQP